MAIICDCFSSNWCFLPTLCLVTLIIFHWYFWRLHDLSEFDDRKRSCRRRLSAHNARRRRPQSEDKKFSSTRMFRHNNTKWLLGSYHRTLFKNCPVVFFLVLIFFNEQIEDHIWGFLWTHHLIRHPKVLPTLKVDVLIWCRVVAYRTFPHLFMGSFLEALITVVYLIN